MPRLSFWNKEVPGSRAAWQVSKGISQRARMGFKRTVSRFVLRNVLRPNQLDSLQPNEKPSKRLVFLWKEDSFVGSGQLERYVQAIAGLLPSKQRTQSLARLAAFVAASNQPLFLKLRRHFGFMDVDSKGNVWFSNSHGQRITTGGFSQKEQASVERLKAKARNRQERIENAIRQASIKPEPHRKRIFRGLRNAVVASMVALGINAAVAAPIAGLAVQRLQKATEAQLGQLALEMHRIRIEPSSKKQAELEQEWLAVYKRYDAVSNQSFSKAIRIRHVPIAVRNISLSTLPLLVFGLSLLRKRKLVFEKPKRG